MHSRAGLVGLMALSVTLIQCNGEGDDPPPEAMKQLFIVDSSAEDPYTTARQNMMSELASRGYFEGQQVEVTYHAIDNDEARGRQVLGTARDAGADVVVVNGTVAARAARTVLEGERDLPVVFTSVTDPIGEGLVTAFDQPPPANITGVAFTVPVQNRFNVIKRRYPHDPARDLRIGLVHTDMPQSRGYRRLIEAAQAGAVGSADEGKTYARLTGVSFVFREVPFRNGAGAVDAMVADAREQILAIQDQVDLFVSPSDVLGTNEAFARMVWETANTPLIGLQRNDVVQRWGALGSIYPSVPDIGRQAGEMVARLFEGEPVSTVHPENPARTGYALDLDKAAHFGLQVSDEVTSLIRPEDLVGERGGAR